MDTKKRDISNLRKGVAYNEAHIKDHSKQLKEHQAHLDKMERKKKVVARIPLQKVGNK